MKRNPILLPIGIFVIAWALALPSPAGDAEDAPPYVFSHGFDGEKSPEPRGGNTRGAPVTPDPDTAAVYERLQAPGLSKKERDRRAILALTGEYRTTFEFVETAPLAEGYERAEQPYRSWATEYVFALEDRPDVIRLQHILVMVIREEDGGLSDPIVTKHWRQDWHWRPATIWRYEGDRVWAREPVPEAEAEGAWKQVVHQVDDSPRYSALGRWHHENGVSEWRSENFLRPLPRRERTVRDDYEALAGRHGITVTPHGWLHEQDNRKLRRAEDGTWQAVAGEVGLNRYRRITGRDFSPGRAYWRRTAPFWTAVRAKWRQLRGENERLRIRHERDGKTMFARLLTASGEVSQGASSQALREKAAGLIAPYVEPLPER